MKDAYNILVIINPKHDNSPVINRAKEFAKVTKASLHLLICSESKKSANILEKIVNDLHAEGFQVTSEITWKKSFHNTIIAVQKDQNCGLVIKAYLPDSALKRVVITPEDWKLLRTCPCPILIANQEKTWSNRPVLAAVDLGNPNKSHAALHNAIVKLADTITHIEDAGNSLHLVSVYPSPIFSEIHPDSNVPGMTPEIREIYTSACKKYEEQYASLTQENIHLIAGAPDILIPKTAKQIDAAVCVIGTVARTGISGKLIGNTVESILDDLECDVLVIKPDSIDTEVAQLIKQIQH